MLTETKFSAVSVHISRVASFASSFEPKTTLLHILGVLSFDRALVAKALSPLKYLSMSLFDLMPETFLRNYLLQVF